MRDRLAKPQRDLDQAVAKLEAERARLAETEAAVRQATAEKAAAVDEPTVWLEADETIRRYRAEAERLTGAIARREGDVLAAQAKVDGARFEEATAKFEDACAHRSEVAGEFSKLLARTVTAGVKLCHLRAAAAAARAQAQELAPDGAFVDWPGDEPAFPAGVPELVAMLEAGPAQPLESESKALARATRDGQRANADRVEWAVKQMLGVGYDRDLVELVLGRLREDLRPEARRRYELELAKLRVKGPRTSLGASPINEGGSGFSRLART